MVNAAVERNMGVLAAINTTPIWVGPPMILRSSPTRQVRRIRGPGRRALQGQDCRLRGVERAQRDLLQNPVDPVFYTRMLQAAYPAIKAADPEAVVVGGVVLAAYTAGSIAINPSDLVATMYENGAKGYFDAISYHPYHPDFPSRKAASSYAER